MLLREQDGDSRVTLAVGDTLEVVLEENATTGYLWQVTDLSGVSLDGSELRPATDFRPGAAGEHRFRLRAVAAGEGRVLIELRRPWEDDAPAARRFSVELSVTSSTP